MSLDLAISPAGRLFVEENPEAFPVLDAKAATQLRSAFEASNSEGLILLVGECLTTALPPSFSFWRDFVRRYMTGLSHLPAELPPNWSIPAPGEAVLESSIASAPPMRGLEFIHRELLLKIWVEIEEAVRMRIASKGSGLAEFLKNLNPLWHTVGRVTFHLAENKKDEQRPFAFMATYTHAISQDGKSQYLPLGRALTEYAGEANKSALISLLSPVQRAAQKSSLARELVDSSRIFQPQAWSPSQALRFLKDIPVFENSGVLVRIPNWWSPAKPRRAQVSVKIGQKSSTGLTADTLLDFSVGMTLDGEEITSEEWKKLMASTESLVLLKGKWVEVDKQKLSEVLQHWKQVEKAQNDGVSFLEGMRLLAGFQPAMDQVQVAPETERAWSEVVAGDFLRQALEKMRDPATVGECEPNRDLRAQLRAYQEDGVKWLWFMNRLGLGACLADDMGLGKTIQIISLLLQLKRQGARPPSLLVVPASLISNWRAEIERFAPQVKFYIAHVSEHPAEELAALGGKPEFLASYQLVITTYGLLNRLSWMKETSWDLAVLDEAQAIKNPGSQQTRSAKQLKARCRIALSGTPVENRLSDLWSLFDFICPGLLGSAKQFGQFVKDRAKLEHDQFAPLRSLVRPYILRRLKTDKKIISDLPDKTEMQVFCSLSKAQAALYQQSVQELAKRLDETEGIQRRGIILAFLTRFKQICNHPSHWVGDQSYDPAQSGKFARLGTLCEEISERQEKALIFTQYREMTGPLANFLQTVFHRPGLILHGDTPVKNRQALVNEFQQDGGPPFFVLSLKAGGTGLNLTGASHVFHFDRWWNPAVENQATDRAFRIGQKRNVLVHKLVCRGTVEERIDALIREKQGLADDILGGGAEKMLTEMKNDELLKFVSLDIHSAVQE